MATKKRPVKTDGMKVKAYMVLDRAVEEGVRYGWHRAHKHTDTPSQETIEATIARAVMDAICEVFDFDE